MSTNFDFNGFYAIVVQKISNNDAAKIFSFLWINFIYNVNIITIQYDNCTHVVMKTFFPFHENACHQTNPIVINKFYDNDARKKQQWMEKNFFPYKFKDFHNCSIRAATFEYAPAVFLEKEEDENDNFNLRGSDIELMRGLKATLNFHLNLTYSNDSAAFGITYENGTVTGLKIALLNNEYDLLFGMYYATYPNCKYMSCSQPYYAVAITFIVPQRSLTSIQKFFVPFKLGLWIALALLLSIAILVIAIVEYKIKFARNFVIGGNVQNPYIEMLTAFIGNSSNNLPRRSFARYLLMNFILFALVMRTVYTAGLFKFLQADTKISTFETLKDFIESKYKIYALPHFSEYLGNMGLKSR